MATRRAKRRLRSGATRKVVRKGAKKKAARKAPRKSAKGAARNKEGLAGETQEPGRRVKIGPAYDRADRWRRGTGGVLDDFEKKEARTRFSRAIARERRLWCWIQTARRVGSSASIVRVSVLERIRFRLPSSIFRSRQRRSSFSPLKPEGFFSGCRATGSGRRRIASSSRLRGCPHARHSDSFASSPTSANFPFMRSWTATPTGFPTSIGHCKVGSGNAAHLSQFFCVPQARYLGVTPQDIIDYQLPTHPLAEVDSKRAKDALKNDAFFRTHRGSRAFRAVSLGSED